METIQSDIFAADVSKAMEEKYGFLITILTIIQIIAAVIQIYQFCNKDAERVCDDIKSMSMLNKVVFKRVIKRYVPDTTPKMREAILVEIINKAKELSKEQVNVIMAELN